MLILRGQRVFVPEGARAASLYIENGIITDIRHYDDVPDGVEVIEGGTSAVIPGLVDTHVHVNEPGRSDWEGFDTATRAAAAGGVTTIIDMPLNSIPATTTVEALTAKREAATGRCHVDVGFWGGIVPDNASQIGPLVAAGVRGFKCFMAPSGVDEFRSVSVSDLRRALSRLAQEPDRVPLLVHAEDPSRLRSAHGDARSYETFLDTRPPEAEVAAIDTMTALAREYDVSVHIVHVASGDAARAVFAAQAAQALVSAETCPHYLTFAADEIAEGATQFKCAPPIRQSPHREELWRALESGVCSMIASDHSPAPRAMKHMDSGDFVSAWGGIASLELSLRAVWTGARARGFGIADVSRWMSEQTARLCGLGARKGAIRPGYDADLVVFDPDAESLVDSASLQQRHKLTPYAGRMLRGDVRATFLRGMKVWEHGKLVRGSRGRLL